jgi:hypothetical protein
VTGQRTGGSPRVFVHVGEPKTGTTFLQQVMWTNKAELLTQGLLVPGQRPFAHWRAAQDLREVEQIPNDPVGPHKGAWDKLVSAALKAPRTAVISHELLSAVDQRHAERGVRSLDGAEVHVVLTVRDFGTLIPAEWQESVKHRSTREWTAWLGDIIDDESGQPDRRRFWFWRVHDTIEILRVWSTLVPPERVHVITVPPRGAEPGLLWRRFAGVLGIDPAIADLGRARTNESLGIAEAEVIRRLNEVLPEDLPNWFYMRNVKDALAHGALAKRRSSLGRLELPPDRDKWARTHAEGVIAELRAGSYDIVGDLDELLPAPPTGTGAQVSDAGTEEMLGAAVAALTALLREIAKTQGVRSDPAAPPAPAGEPATRVDRLKARLIQATEEHPVLHRLRRGYWHLANAARHLRSTARPGPSAGDGPSH